MSEFGSTLKQMRQAREQARRDHALQTVKQEIPS